MASRLELGPAIRTVHSVRITVQRAALFAFVAIAATVGVLAYRTRAGHSYATGNAETDVRAGATQIAYGDTDGLLVPGGRVDLVLELHNHTDHAVTVTAISPAGGASVVDGGCTVDGRDITALPQNLHVVLAPGEDTVTIPGGVYMSKHIRDACTGGTFRLPVYVTVAA